MIAPAFGLSSNAPRAGACKQRQAHLACWFSFRGSPADRLNPAGLFAFGCFSVNVPLNAVDREGIHEH